MPIDTLPSEVEPEHRRAVDALPRRRATDHCPHQNKHHDYPVLHTMAQYLVISASISVLLMTWHIFQAVKRLESAVVRIEPVMAQQNAIMTDIHASIHAEGAAIREAVRK